MSLLKSLNGVVQGGHHLHLELEVLLRSQRRRHRDPGTLVVLTLLLARTGTGAPGVHHLIGTKDFTSKDIVGINSDGYDNSLRKKTQP